MACSPASRWWMRAGPRRSGPCARSSPRSTWLRRPACTRCCSALGRALGRRTAAPIHSPFRRGSTKMKRSTITVSLAMSMVLLAGCAKKAEGQVAAVVNGEEITLQEVNAELGDGNVPEGAAGAAARQTALQRIVQRRLLAQTARDEGLDK